eukprot:465808_1
MSSKTQEIAESIKSERKYRNIMNKNEFDNDDENKSNAYSHIIDVLELYKKISNTSGNYDEMIQKYFEDKSKFIKLLDQYHNILHQCQTPGKYEKIYDIMIKSVGQCNLSKCNSFRRNQRLIKEEQKRNENEKNLNFYKDIIDTLHCFFIHSFDSGMRLKAQELNKIMETVESKNNDPDDDNIENVTPHDESMDKLNQTIKQKKEKIKELQPIDKTEKNKFFTETTKGDEKLDISAEKRFSSYSFGHRYYYWDEFKLNEQADYGPNVGFKKKYWYIPKKYDDLREEILNNNICKLDKTTYDSYITKAENYINCKRVKEMKIDSIYSEAYKKKTTEPVSIDNLLSVILYTDESDLCYYFSSTFRKKLNETNKEMKKRNSEYWQWSRTLHETIELYGTPICNSTVPVYYHGVSYMTFPSFVAHFCGPTSTTAQIAVATNFAKGKGIILELIKENEFSCLKLFDCSWISRFSAEDERFFIGGDKPLRFASIRLVEQNQNLVHYVYAFTILNYVIEGHTFEGKYTVNKKGNYVINKKGKIKQIFYKIIRRLLQHFDPRINYQSNKDCKYGIDLFRTFCDSKKQITINLEIMNTDYPG